MMKKVRKIYRIVTIGVLSCKSGCSYDITSAQKGHVLFRGTIHLMSIFTILNSTSELIYPKFM